MAPLDEPQFSRTDTRMEKAFDLDSALKASSQGWVHEWVQDYLRAGTWVNLGLADGLLGAPRWWVGPFSAPLEAFTRKCGPEPEMEYVEPLADWKKCVETMAATITSAEQLPPLIVERRASGWFIADGNHRHEALRLGGFKSCWALGGLNSESEFNLVKSTL